MIIRRIINLLKILFTYYYSRITKRPVHAGYPFSISIEPANLCNLACPECPSGNKTMTREKGIARPDTVKKIIDQASPYAFYLNLTFQGEPFLNPSMVEYIKMAKKRKLYVTTSTNGHFLDPKTAEDLTASGLDSIIISVDGITQETYEKYRAGGSLEKVIEGIKNLKKAKIKAGKRKPEIIVQFLVFSHNEHQIKDIKRLGKEWGADTVRLKPAQIYDFEKGSQLMTNIKRWSRYKKVSGSWFLVPGSSVNKKQETRNKKQDLVKYRLKHRLRNHCFRMWSNCVITWDGRVVPCCFDKDAEFEMGNILKEDFMDIWKGKKYEQFRKKILMERKDIVMCRNCVSRS